MSEVTVLAQPARCVMYPKPEVDETGEPLGSPDFPVYLIAVAEHDYLIWIGGPDNGMPVPMPTNLVARMEFVGDDELIPSTDHTCSFPAPGPILCFMPPEEDE